jgi:IS30 family transposase
MLRKLTNKRPQTIYDEDMQAVRRILPKSILHDNGTEFVLLDSKLNANHNIKIFKTSTYSPQANSIVERKNREIRDILRRYFVQQNSLKWFTYIDELQNILNNSFVKTIKGTSNEIINENKIPYKSEDNNSKTKQH